LLDSVGAGLWVYPWLLMVGSGNLLVAAGGVMLALFPERYGGLASFLRLGKGMSIFSFFLLLLSGALRATSAQRFVQIAGATVPRSGILGLIVVVDLFFLFVLLRWRSQEGSRAPIPPAA
jgi:hypothetical protein